MRSCYTNATVAWNEGEIARRESLIREIPLQLLDALKNHDHGLEHQRRRALAAFDKKWDDTLFAIFPEARDPNYVRHREGNNG